MAGEAANVVFFESKSLIAVFYFGLLLRVCAGHIVHTEERESIKAVE